ncbi:MAG: cob(I)yrinic acid a,c-diamide adenosyltransferase [Deltaproteobacteria bacterium]|nr:cob(I)yrinic acid a,c-diamide adenosyltransferase [Deltaproteobacteria bacterium]
MTIATRKGDKGTTKFFSGETVSKSHPRLEAYGTLDELVSALGFARSLSKVPRVADETHAVQRILFQLGAELATDNSAGAPFPITPIAETEVARLDAHVAYYESQLTLPPAFIIPGGCQSAGALDVARTVCRRLERRIMTLVETCGYNNPEAIKYVNRLSDVCFLWARAEEHAAGVQYDRVK